MPVEETCLTQFGHVTFSKSSMSKKPSPAKSPSSTIFSACGTRKKRVESKANPLCGERPQSREGRSEGRQQQIFPPQQQNLSLSQLHSLSSHKLHHILGAEKALAIPIHQPKNNCETRTRGGGGQQQVIYIMKTVSHTVDSKGSNDRCNVTRKKKC